MERGSRRTADFTSRSSGGDGALRRRRADPTIAAPIAVTPNAIASRPPSLSPATGSVGPVGTVGTAGGGGDTRTLGVGGSGVGGSGVGGSVDTSTVSPSPLHEPTAAALFASPL